MFEFYKGELKKSFYRYKKYKIKDLYFIFNKLYVKV